MYKYSSHGFPSLIKHPPKITAFRLLVFVLYYVVVVVVVVYSSRPRHCVFE